MAGDGKESGADDPERRFRIFLSSTSEDLEEYRAGVAVAIESLDQKAERMETFVADPRTPLEVCRRKAVSADAMVVIVAHRYGWIPSVRRLAGKCAQFLLLGSRR